jgi:hypothetical protein
MALARWVKGVSLPLLRRNEAGAQEESWSVMVHKDLVCHRLLQRLPLPERPVVIRCRGSWLLLVTVQLRARVPMTANRGREAVVAVAGWEANAGTNAGTEARGLACPFQDAAISAALQTLG